MSKEKTARLAPGGSIVAGCDGVLARPKRSDKRETPRLELFRFKRLRRTMFHPLACYDENTRRNLSRILRRDILKKCVFACSVVVFDMMRLSHCDIPFLILGH